MTAELKTIVANYSIFAVIWYVLQTYGHFLLFKKAKVNTMIAFIPVIREYKMFQMVWDNKIISLVWIIGVIGLPLFVIGSKLKLQSIAWIGFVLSLIALVLSAIRAFYEVRAYNKGPGMAIAIIFVAPLANIILGKSDADYQKNQILN